MINFEANAHLFFVDYLKYYFDRSGVFHIKTFLILAKFTQKHLCRILYLKKLQIIKCNCEYDWCITRKCRRSTHQTLPHNFFNLETIYEYGRHKHKLET